MKEKVRFTLFLIVTGWMLLAVTNEVQANEPDSLDMHDYPYIRIVNTPEEADQIVLTDSDFLESAGRLCFVVNYYDQYTDSTLLQELAEGVLPALSQRGLQLVRVAFRGAASPDGPYAFNRMLSEKRAEALVFFLRAHLRNYYMQAGDSTETIAMRPDIDARNVVTVAEDYDLLVAMMRRAGDADAERVAQLVQQYSPKRQFATLKRRLQQMDEGRVWNHMRQAYFPDLRAARVIMFFTRPAVPQKQQAEQSVLPVPERPTFVPEPMQPRLQLPADTLRLARRELLSVKSNVLLDLAYMPGYNRWCPIPNIAVEYYPLHGHMTYGASIDFPWWQHYWQYKYFELRNYQLEARYYLRSGDIRTNTPGQGQAFRGFYLQGYVHAGLFLFCFNRDKGWTGEYLGGGVGFGYVMPLARRWRLELGMQVGVIVSQYDPFQFEYRGNVELNDHLYYYDWTLPAHQFKKRQYRYTWIGPTRIGITLSYDLLYRRRSKKGVSLKSYEKIERRYER